MTLYSGMDCPLSHRTRIAVAEKGIAVDIINIDDSKDLPEDLIDLNPYNALPTLVDRDLILYDSRLIMEYLNERYPHPPLMPIDPVSRARTRLMLYRIDRDWYSLLHDLISGMGAQATNARKAIQDGLTSIAPAFSQKTFFVNDEFSLVDCCIAPLLWRLPAYGIELPGQARPLLSYAQQLFSRRSFQSSLTDAERELRAQAA